MIFYGTQAIDDSTPREQRIEAAEDRAEMRAEPQCPAPACAKEAFLILAGNKAYCRDHYVALGGVI